MTLAIVGSVLTAQFTPASDVDVLVKFEFEYTPILFEIGLHPGQLSEWKKVLAEVASSE